LPRLIDRLSFLLKQLQLSILANVFTNLGHYVKYHSAYVYFFICSGKFRVKSRITSFRPQIYADILHKGIFFGITIGLFVYFIHKTAYFSF
jgi:hypothetical protein